jgi:hypothetical protein
MNRIDLYELGDDGKQQIAKRTLKDSVFINAFREKGMALELYKDLHRGEEEDIKESDVNIVTLNNILIDGPVNDLGMVVKNTVLCLVEAQSTKMKTIMLRTLIYLGRTMEQYLSSRNLTTYTASEESVPRWEIYIIYSEKAGLEGGAQVWRFDRILSDLFDMSERETIPIQEKGIVKEYIDICAFIDRIIIRKGYEKDAVRDLIRYCRENRGALMDYIVSKEAEVMGLYEEMWTKEGSIQARENEIRRISLEEGEAKGKDMMHNAFSMLKADEPIEKIAEFTGLSEEEILSLKRELFPERD